MAGYLVLVCGVLASLALGVLVAYGIALGMFQVFRVHAANVAAARVAKAGAQAQLRTEVRA